jgi:hypothetical protein
MILATGASGHGAPEGRIPPIDRVYRSINDGPQWVDAVEKYCCVDVTGMIPFSSGFARETR